MLDNMLLQFRSFYDIPGLVPWMVLLAIALAVVFAAIWLIIYRAWHLNKAWLVVTLIISAVLTWSAIAFVQLPLQIWYQDLMMRWLGQANFMQNLLLTGIPLVLLSGLVQEGTKMVPVIALWATRQKQIEPLTGLYAGAISGAGFGIFEAIWIHNSIFASGWTWEIVSIYGISGLLGFWERFFAIGMHIAVSALAGYGWAKGLKWQYYLIAAGLHALTNFGVILLSNGNLSANQVELYVAIVAIGCTVWAFLALRSANRPPDEPPVAETITDSEYPPDY
jgi:RsiW-degrading membrane proteinase PrsW (M82 family)